MDDDSWPLSDYDEAMRQDLISPPALPELDTGPYDAWYKVNADRSCEDFIYADDNEWLRRRGYVMWDRSRLQLELKFFDHQPCKDAPEEDDIAPLLSEEDVEHSYKRRSEIWRKGGRGWWSKDDESHIVWPSGGWID